LAVAGVLSALALVALVGRAGSSNDGTPAARQSQPAAVTSVTPGSHLGHGTSDAAGECASRMPGDVLTAAEAVVRFSAQRVCLGYVTVAPGTEVSWQNAGDQPGTVTVTTPTPVTSPAVAPGDTWTHRFDDRGVFSYRIDVLPAFVGTVEVVSP
jgi:plastocyanin